MAFGKDDLIGAWQLDDMYAEGEDGTKSYPMGRNPGGTILYTPDGYMTAITHRKDRFLPADRPSDDEMIEAFQSYLNYAGKWELESSEGGATVSHTIEHALNPNMVGKTLQRRIVSEGGRLIFSGKSPDGATNNVIIWKRRS